MNRTFIFCIQGLNYQKSDLSIPYSNNRIIIGTLSRMITNAIFLSHKIRQNITIRIFILQPKPHLYEIKSESIRYLGPDLRSSASLLLKGEQYLFENQKKMINNKQLIWYEPNPGLFLCIINNPFIELDIRKTSKVFYFTNKNFDVLSNKSNISLKTFNELLQQYKPQIFCFNFGLDISNNHFNLDFLKEKHLEKINLINQISFPTLVSIINLLLDDMKIKDV